MCESMLTRLGYTFTGLTNSLHALQFILENNAAIDVLITDQTMPGLTGVELAKEVLKVRADLPIILCTGFSSEVNAEQAAEIGISRFVMKPYKPSELGKIIREVLDAKKARR